MAYPTSYSPLQRSFTALFVVAYMRHSLLFLSAFHGKILAMAGCQLLLRLSMIDELRAQIY